MWRTDLENLGLLAMIVDVPFLEMPLLREGGIRHQFVPLVHNDRYLSVCLLRSYASYQGPCRVDV